MTATPINDVAGSDGFYYYRVEGDPRQLAVRPEQSGGKFQGWFPYVDRRRAYGCGFREQHAAVDGGLLWMRENPPPPATQQPPPSLRSTVAHLTAPELATILAALRHYQQTGQGDPANRADMIHNIATDNGRLVSLDSSGIDDLCNRINIVGEAELERLWRVEYRGAPGKVSYGAYNSPENLVAAMMQRALRPNWTRADVRLIERPREGWGSEHQVGAVATFNLETGERLS
jgi:hypothetical protein